MKYQDTVANTCRYGEVAAAIWDDWDIVWEDSESDYQGHASILAEKDGKYCFYEWWYGSCSGCDDWEARNLDDDKIEKEMRDTALWLDDKQELIRWMNNACMIGIDEGRQNYNMDGGGGLAAGIDILCGGAGDRFQEMRKAAGLEAFKFEDCK